MNSGLFSTYRPTLKFPLMGKEIRWILFPLGVCSGRLCKGSQDSLHYLHFLYQKSHEILSLLKHLYLICFLLEISTQNSDSISDSSEQQICIINKPKPEDVIILFVFIPLSSQGLLGGFVLLNLMHFEHFFMKWI